ncbi:unnamed protein product [Periconia digitata]|uniref:BTB domain-containing protein n=1 Tax=Periconia digitata TaxID=1303443 RepID=A0A9W4XP72_9PLEO|nr:unnamed protein product [Periconia digitata]
MPPQPQPQLTIGDWVQGPTATVQVGSDHQAYQVHRDLLTHHSEYFVTAFNGHWRESNGTVVMDDVDPSVFNVFVHWLYAQDLPNDEEEWIRVAVLPHNGNPPMSALEACAFGDRILAPKFFEAAWNAYVNMTWESDVGTSYEEVRFVSDNLPAKDFLMQYLVLDQCRKWYHTTTTENLRFEDLARENLPNEFMAR